jgi:hypothetical protein
MGPLARRCSTRTAPVPVNNAGTADAAELAPEVKATVYASTLTHSIKVNLNFSAISRGRFQRPNNSAEKYPEILIIEAKAIRPLTRHEAKTDFIGAP